MVKKIRGERRRLLYICLLVVCIFILLLGYRYYVRMFRTNLIVHETEYLYIYTGSDFQMVLDSLTAKNYLRDIESFKRTAIALGYVDNVRSGRYKLTPGMSNRQLVNMLISGIQTPVRVTFSNARVPEQLMGKISKQLEPDSLAFVSYFRNRNTSMKYGFTGETLISMFIPNTYEFYWNITPEMFFDRMKREYELFWNGERKTKAKEIGLSLTEVSILASIVEEETIKSDERARVAGVYMNRLKKRMYLQADPTVKFALNDFSIRRVLTKHLDVKSPYNTYRNYGLPPGPIRCPSVSSIDAVLNYEHHNYLYFCAKDDFSGYHSFAKTLVEHNRNADEYRKALNRERIYR